MTSWRTAAAVAMSLSLNADIRSAHRPFQTASLRSRSSQPSGVSATLQTRRSVGATPALDDVRCLELIEDRSDGCRRQLGALGELAGGHLVLTAEGRDGPDLREGKLARSAVIAATKPAIGGEQLVDRRAELFHLAGGFGDG